MKSAFVIGAPSSGAGKTTVTLALLAALTRRGLRVQSFKVGPDYIDPAHHAMITGRPAPNLDTWMLPESVNHRLFAHALADADVGVVEGVMGLHDSVDGVRADGSTALAARTLGLPVLLVVDARSMARSGAALVKGYVEFDPQVDFAGVAWNRVGSSAHRHILDDALAASGTTRSLGAFGRRADFTLPERHLGLVMPEEAGLDPELFDAMAKWAEEALDLDGLLERTRLEPPPTDSDPDPAKNLRGNRIGIARDKAFCFYYQENLRLLSARGAELVFFRPTEGDGVPPGLDALYLGGGYPELHAEAISSNRGFLDGLRALHDQEIPLYAECGGFMVLCRALEDPGGRRWPMADIFPTTARMNERAFRLGYREVTGLLDSPVAGMSARGHEFHYSRIDPMDASGPAVTHCYRVFNARGVEQPPEGYRLGRTVGGYIHLHFGSNPDFALGLLGLA